MSKPAKSMINTGRERHTANIRQRALSWVGREGESVVMKLHKRSVNLPSIPDSMLLTYWLSGCFWLLTSCIYQKTKSFLIPSDICSLVSFQHSQWCTNIMRYWNIFISQWTNQQELKVERDKASQMRETFTIINAMTRKDYSAIGVCVDDVSKEI